MFFIYIDKHLKMYMVNSLCHLFLNIIMVFLDVQNSLAFREWNMHSFSELNCFFFNFMPKKFNPS